MSHDTRQKEAELSIAFTLSTFIIAISANPHGVNLRNPGLLLTENMADSNQVSPKNADTIDFSSLISSESAKKNLATIKLLL